MAVLDRLSCIYIYVYICVCVCVLLRGEIEEGSALPTLSTGVDHRETKEEEKSALQLSVADQLSN